MARRVEGVGHLVPHTSRLSLSLAMSALAEDSVRSTGSNGARACRVGQLSQSQPGCRSMAGSRRLSLLMNAAAKVLLRKQLRGVSAGAYVVLLRRVPGRESACRREPVVVGGESFCDDLLLGFGILFPSPQASGWLSDYVALAPGAEWRKQQTTFAREPSATRFFLACCS